MELARQTLNRAKGNRHTLTSLSLRKKEKIEDALTWWLVFDEGRAACNWPCRFCEEEGEKHMVRDLASFDKNILQVSDEEGRTARQAGTVYIPFQE